MAKTVVVVGAGAAGIIAAWRAANLGAKVILLEKTARIGTKILISGGGKCNIAHDGPIEGVLKAFRPNEARFIRPACYRWTNQQIIEMFTAKGLEVYTRPNGRVFPLTGTAKDVVEILRQYLVEAGVEVRLETPVTEILTKDGAITGVRTEAGEIKTDTVILCVGGSSYPGTGTTGDGYPWLKTLGHKTVPIKAALAPMRTHPAPTEWSGVALRDCILKARQNGKEFVRWRDDLLFTHHGVSGPTVLGISRECAEKMPTGEVWIEADVTPDTSFEDLSAQIQAWVKKFPKRYVRGFVDQYVAERLALAMLALAGIPDETICTNLGKKERNRLIEIMKGWSLGRVTNVVLNKGEVVAGGVPLDEVDPQTMRSLRTQGLYLCGEILDIAGPVGGYNLQAAFSTGYIAAESAATA
ncbi:MAG: aminoacetone oxidase family FAD-binding enzyme [Armatimonadetes bacterium]|nr:aminoacetone oxidase family FAD-binding enzyme [Armatimonadota bacterium]